MQEDPATFLESTIAKAGKQAPKSGYGFLEAVLDSLDDGPLLEALTARQTYGPSRIFRSRHVAGLPVEVCPHDSL